MTDNHRLTGSLYAVLNGNLLMSNASVADPYAPHVVKVEAADLVDVVKLIIAKRPDIAMLVAAAAHDAGYAQRKAEEAPGTVQAVPGVVVEAPATARVAEIVDMLVAEEPYGPRQVYPAMLGLCRVVDRLERASVQAGPPVARLEQAIYNSTTGILDRLRRVEDLCQQEWRFSAIESGWSLLRDRVIKLEAARPRDLVSRDGRADEDMTSGDPAVDEVRSLAAVVEGQQCVIDALIARCEALDQAKATAAWVAELPSRDWVKDQIGQAITKHAGAMHQRIEQILTLAKRYTDQAMARPGLARRLWAAVTQPVATATREMAPASTWSSPEDATRAVVAAAARAAGKNGQTP